MEFLQAYNTIVKRSVEKNTKEIPTILSCLDFKNKNCLEIGAGPLARLAIKISELASHITCLETNQPTIDSINKIIKQKNLNNKISAQLYQPSNPLTLPFDDNSFDVIYGAWLPHKLITNKNFLDELIRISKKHILLLIPGIQGDEPGLVSIIRPGEKQRRKEYQKLITDHFKNNNLKVKIKSDILKLNFKNQNEIQETYYCLAFKNQPLKDKKQEVDDFLQKRAHNFQNGFYCLHAEK